MAYVVRIGKTAYAVSAQELIRATRWCEMKDNRSAGNDPQTPAKKPGAPSRQDNLAAALRDNLLKRKQQSRVRAGASVPENTPNVNK